MTLYNSSSVPAAQEKQSLQEQQQNSLCSPMRTEVLRGQIKIYMWKKVISLHLDFSKGHILSSFFYSQETVFAIVLAQVSLSQFLTVP